MASSVWEIAPPYDKKLDTTLKKYPKVIRQLAGNRNMQSKEELEIFMNPSYGKDVLNPYLFKDMKKVVDRIITAKENSEKITIYGDYDADGITGSAILGKVFEKLDIEFDVYMPHRLTEGYGLNKNAIDTVLKSNTKVIVTVDCGISNVDAVEYASNKNIDVIITDHHQLLQEIPKAYAILHPSLKGETYPDKELTGGGVAFKLAQGIIKKNEGIFDSGFDKWLLDMVAISTVADFGNLLGENRSLVKYGIIVFNKTKNRGLQELKKLNGNKTNYSTMDLAMKIIPLINAAGRMSHAITSYNALTEESDKVIEYVNTLKMENERRREISEKIYKQACIQAEEQNDENLIIVENEEWPVTLVGIAAARIMNDTGKPTIAIGYKNDARAGSGRSSPVFNLAKAFQENEDLFEEYGGHVSAGGFTIKESVAVEKCIERLKKYSKKVLKNQKLKKTMNIDAKISIKDINEDLLDLLEKMAPFGQGNPKPKFLIENMKLENVFPLGKSGAHMKLLVSNPNGGHMKCIFFNGTKNYSDTLVAGKKMRRSR